MILAIVGTRRFGNPNAMRYATALINLEVHRMKHGETIMELAPYWDSFVTGDASGIDALVKDTCDGGPLAPAYSVRRRRDCIVLSPVHKRWEPEGDKARNILVAETCDALLCIRDPESSTYGSGWTADYAESLGKPVTRVTIS